MQRMTWVNGAQKRIKLKSDKKKGNTGEAQRQFFSSERHARLMQAAPAAGSALQLKSLDVQSLSIPPLAGGLEASSPVFVSPRPKAGEEQVRAVDTSFDKPARAPPAVFTASLPPPAAVVVASKLDGERIRFYNQGTDVTDEVYQRFAAEGVLG